MKKIFALIGLLVFTSGISQSYNGKIHFKTKSTPNDSIESIKSDEIEEQKIAQIITTQMEFDYELAFNDEKSLYSQKEKLDDNTNSKIVVIVTGEPDILYRDLENKIYYNKTEIYGKPFLIKDELKKIDWKLLNETKKIGDYICNKATAQVETISSVNNVEVVELKEVIAWYTSSIPIPHGPDKYWGLPGLILEVNVGNFMISCYDIKLDNKEKIIIREPKRGKIVSQVKFDKIMKEKQEEVEKANQNNRNSDDKEVRISVRG